MPAHKFKTKSLLIVFLITALPLSLLALAVNRLEAVALRESKVELNTVLFQSNGSTADLSLSKDVDDLTPLVGTQVVFTLQVNNDGPNNAHDIVISDTLPSGYTYISHDGDGDYDPGTGVWFENRIGDGNFVELQITAMVNASGNYTNVAQITTLDEVDPNLENNQDSVTTFPFRLADLSMTKDVDKATPDVGTPVVFNLRVDNDGPSNAIGVVVSDQLPSGYTYISDDGGGDYDPGTGIWTVGEIADGAFDELQITATVNASGEYTNVAQITDLIGIDPDSDNNQDSATTNPIAVADLEIKKRASSDEVKAGEDLTFTLVITNNGPSLARTVQVTDDLPVELRLITISTTVGSCGGNGLISCDLGDLVAKGVVTVTILVNVDMLEPGSLQNTASAVSLTKDPLDLNNRDTISINVLPRKFLLHLPIFNKGEEFGEPNDQCETATDILVNLDNEYLPEDRDDWYQFDLPSSGNLLVELSNFTPMKGQLTVFRGDSCSSRLLLGINGNPAVNKVVDLGTQPAGHYYIYVSNDAAPSTVPYTLRVNFTP